MAIIQVLTDSNNNVVGVQVVAQSSQSQALAVLTQSYKGARDSGLARQIEIETAKTKVDLSPVLTGEQKEAAKSILQGAQVGDLIRFVSQPLPPVIPPAITDNPVPPARPLIQVYVDP